MVKKEAEVNARASTFKASINHFIHIEMERPGKQHTITNTTNQQQQRNLCTVSNGMTKQTTMPKSREIRMRTSEMKGTTTTRTRPEEKITSVRFFFSNVVFPIRSRIHSIIVLMCAQNANSLPSEYRPASTKLHPSNTKRILDIRENVDRCFGCTIS